MIYLSDKQRCELSFVGRLIHLLILGGITSGNHQELADIALKISEEPFIGATNIDSLKRRVIRMERNTIAPLAGKSHGEKILLICYYFINTLVDEGILAMPEESNLAKLVDFLLELIDVENEVVQKRMASADKQARKWLETLRSEGYYL